MDQTKLDRIVLEARRNAEQRAAGYREQALKLFPWVCGRCAQTFARELVAAASDGAAKIDELIASASKNWRIDRMSRVDRNILRLGVCELVAFRDVPVKVVINEAVELAKRFGTAESSAFVNGVLDRIATAVGRHPES